MTTLVACKWRWLERTYARLLGGVSSAGLAAASTEEQLRIFPAEAWCRSQEANIAVLARLQRTSDWSAIVSRTAERRQLSAQALDRLISQIFVMTWGRRLASLRMCLAVLDGPVRFVTDLPRPLVAAYSPELQGRVVVASALSLPLRVGHAVDAAARLMGRHALRIGRLFGLRRLPHGRGGEGDEREYVAWLGALPSEVSAIGGERFSLLEFLVEAREQSPSIDVVVQGAQPVSLPDGFKHRRYSPSLRFRPDWRRLVLALLEQCRQALWDVAHGFDFRQTTLLGPAVLDVAGLRLWFASDPPRAVLYANHQIGGEPPVAALAVGVPAAMVFYSANVAFRPRNSNAPGTRLEPEMRYIVADRLTMWSPEMTQVFGTAGYESTRLVETGPIVFGRQRDFRPTSRYVKGLQAGPTRIGIFDVAILRPESRFAAGYGLLTYNREATERFFADVFSAAVRRFGQDVVIVRKAKRAYHPTFGEDVDFASLPPVAIEFRDPAESLWRALEAVDLVVCMPFTSVAYVADECGIPAAYYDPGQDTEPSPLGGRVPVLFGPAALDDWLRTPAVPRSRLPGSVAARVLAAAIGTPITADSSQHPGRAGKHVVHT